MNCKSKRLILFIINIYEWGKESVNSTSKCKFT